MNIDTSFENSVIRQERTENDKISEMLRAGIKAAQAGNRSEARHLLLNVTEADSANESAWLWLASISEYPEELLVFLKNVLAVNPENERAIEWSKATKSLLAKTFVQRGIDAHKQDQTGFAKQCFLQAIFNDDENELAWLWLASITEAVEEKMSHLQKVLRINPDNETAKASLAAAKSQKAKDLMRKANAAAVSGQTEEANRLLDEILQNSPDLEDAWILKSYLTNSFDEKLEYFEKVLEINPANETAQISINSLRLMKSAVAAKEAEENQNHSQEEVQTETEAETAEISEDYVAAPIETERANFQQPEDERQFGAQIPQPESSFEPLIEESPEESRHAEIEETTPFYHSEIEEVSFENNSYEEVSYEKEFLEIGSENAVSEYAENDEEQIFASEDEEKEDFYSQNHFEEISAEADSFAVETIENSTEEMRFEERQTAEISDETAAAENEYAQFYAPVEEKAEEYQSEEEFTAQPDVFGESEKEPEFARATAEETYDAENADTEEIVIDESITENLETQSNGNGASHYFQIEKVAACPFCRTENDTQAFVCGGCSAVLTLSDLEMLLAHKGTDAEMVGRAVRQMEIEEAEGGFDADNLTMLGIGCINLGNLQNGINYLRKAARLDPTNVLLTSQTHSLAIRLAEIEQQESIHRSMPQDRTIMVVDDSATVRKLICGKLEKSGHTVISAVDGIEALEKLKEITPDLILLDITMPRMDGYQVCKMIRNDPYMKDVPVVMISGKDGFFDKVRGRMAGSTGYITKPFGPETLMKTVEAFVAQRAEAFEEEMIG